MSWKKNEAKRTRNISRIVAAAPPLTTTTTNALRNGECFTHDSFNGVAHTFFMCLKSTYTTISKRLFLSLSFARSLGRFLAFTSIESTHPIPCSTPLSISLNFVDVSALLFNASGTIHTHHAMRVCACYEIADNILSNTLSLYWTEKTVV